MNSSEDGERLERQVEEEPKRADYIELPDGRHVAENGAVVPDPNNRVPEVKPDYEYTPEKEDLNLLIM